MNVLASFSPPRAVVMGLIVLTLAGLPAARAAAEGKADTEDAQRFVAFTEEFTGQCVARNAVQVLVKSTHPSRKIRVWLDRYHMGVGTGDRSRSDLLPAAEPEALGCSRSTTGVQEWRIVRATFID